MPSPELPLWSTCAGGGACEREALFLGELVELSRDPRDAVVEVDVERLPRSQPADQEEGDRWTLRLPAAGEYRVPWEITCDELEEPARGELRLEVVDLVDLQPIRSVKELLGEDV